MNHESNHTIGGCDGRKALWPGSERRPGNGQRRVPRWCSGLVRADFQADGRLPQPQLGFHAPQGFFHGALAVGEGEGFAAGEPLADFVFGREDRAVALAAEVAADFGVGVAGVFAGEPHGEHAGVADGGGFAAGLHLLGFQAEQAADRAGDFRQADRPAGGLHQVGQRVLHEFEVDGRFVGEGGGGQAVHRAGELAGVAGELRGEIGEDFFGDGERFLGGEAAEDFQARGVVGGLHSADKAAGEAGDDFGAERAELGRRTVRGEDELAAFPQEGVDGVQDFDERGLLSGEELHVVNQQQLHLAIFAAEAGEAGSLECFHKVRGELLRREIDDPLHLADCLAWHQIPSSRCDLPQPGGP